MNATKNETILALVSFALFFVFLYFVKSALSPLLLFIFLILFVFPMRHSDWGKMLLEALLLIFVYWVLKELWIFLLPFLISVFLAYLLNPLVHMLERWKCKRIWATIIVVGLIITLFIALTLLILPRTLDELQTFTKQLPNYGKAIFNWIDKMLAKLEKFNLQLSRDDLWNRLMQETNRFVALIINKITGLAANLSTTLEKVLAIAIIPAVTFYLLLDYESFTQRINNLIPPRFKQTTAKAYDKFNHIFASYFRGQLLVAMALGAMMSVGFSIIGLNYALMLGIVGGFLNIIPYLGTTFVTIIAILIGLFSPHPILQSGLALGVIVLCQTIEGNFITPNIVGKKMGLNPVVIILALLVFGKIAGFWGLLFAVPVSAMIKSFGHEIWLSYTKSHFYQGNHEEK